MVASVSAASCSAQTAESVQASDVIQIVTFRFSPGQSGKAIEVFRDQALPLYRRNPHMLEFRAYREVESPEALDLVVISRFNGMAGMDASNARLREVASQTGSSIGAVYGAIGALSTGHTDQFVEIAVGPALGPMDAAGLVVLEYMEADDGVEFADSADQALPIGEPGVSGGIAGTVLIGDGWEFFRMYGVESLATVHAVALLPIMGTVDGRVPVQRRKRVVLAPVPELAVR